MTRRILTVAVVALAAAVLLVAVWPQLFGLERVFGVAHGVSMRGLALTVAGLIAVLLMVSGALNRRIRRVMFPLAATLVAFCLVTFLVLSTRGFGSDERDDAGAGDGLVVLSWNTLGGAPGSQAIADLALSEGADIVVLPETRPAMAAEIVELMRQQGVEMQPFSLSLDDISAARSTALLVSADLGEYRIDDSIASTPTVPSFVAVPVDGDGPTIVAAHPVAPIPGEFRAWTQGLDWVAARCEQPGVILAGDLNSTLDHYERLGTSRTGDLAGCRDGARATGNAALGTWPTQLPPILGSPIDHIMTTSGWTVESFRVIDTLDDSGSDHRPVVATLHVDAETGGE